MDPTPQINPSPVVVAQRSSTKKWMLLLGALVVIGVAVGAYLYYFTQQDAANQLAANPGQITIGSTGFSPTTIKVKKGQAVTWTNQDTAQHAIAADEPNTDLDGSETLEKGDVMSYSFDKAGTYNYHDQMHETSFKGVVIVE